MRRVVVTGIGVINRFDVSDLPCKIAGTVNKAGETPSASADVFDPAQWRAVARKAHAADDRHAFAFEFVDYVRA